MQTRLRHTINPSTRRTDESRRTKWHFVLRLGVAIILLTLLMSLTGTPARAQQPAGGLSWSVEALFNGVVKYGEWLPIRVTLSSAGGDRTVEVRATVTSSEGQANFVQPVELAAGAHKQIDLYVLPASFSRQLRISATEDGTELLSSTVGVQPVTHRTFLAGIIARDPDAFSTLRTISIDQQPGEVRTATLDTDEIPERAQGLASFDALILNDVDTSQLMPAQQRALAAWVQLGGHLVVGGGANAKLTAAGLPAELLPVTLNGTQSVDTVPALTSLGGEPVRVPGPFVVASATTEGGTVLAEQDGQLFVVEQEVGQGHVTFIALDLALSPFNAWAGEQTMWSTLLRPSNAISVEMPPDVSPRQLADQQMIRALTNLPSLDLPSVRWVVLLLAVYILLVGPANYLILRRARRLEWAWFTIPVMTLTFSAGAYGVGYGLRGGEVIMNKLSVIEVTPASNAARVRTYAGLFSPTKRSYSLTVSGEPLISSLNPRYNPWGPSAGGSNITVIQGRPTRVRDLAVNQWAMQTFVAETIVQEPIRIQTDLSYRDGRLQGQATNNGTSSLTDVVVAMGDDFTRLGTIDAGQRVDVDFEIGRASGTPGPPLSYRIFQDQLNSPGPGGPSREIRLKQQVLDSVFAPAFETGYTAGAGPIVIGWLDHSPLSLQVEGASTQEVETALVVARSELSFGEGNVGVPPGFVLPQLVEREGQTGRCSGGRSPGFAPHNGSIVLEFRLPRELHDVDFNHLELIIETDGGWMQPPATALYDWEAGTWHALEDARLGSNPIAEPERFIDATTHALRVQMTADNQRGGCLYTNIALEGTRISTEAKK